MNTAPIRWTRLLLVVCFAPAVTATELTALDRYVAEPDPAYRFTLVKTHPNLNFQTHVIDMTSQTWLSAAEVDRPAWRHWLTIVVPNNVTSSTGLLFIGGGNHADFTPVSADRRVNQIANATGAVVAELSLVPNQPLVFRGETKGRIEDSLIAYAWDKYLRTGETKWLPRLPMTKAAVRAMDTVTTFLRSEQGGGVNIDKFVVTGGSKRGWTAWTTAAVDKRVVAIIPMVIDLLNLEPSFLHHWRAYGFWAPAVADYVEMGIMNWMKTPQFRSMLSIVEPYSYRERFTMPKFMINASGDQFFLPDSSQFYFDDLPGEKYLRYVPNTDHSLKNSDAVESLVAYLRAILKDSPRPSFSWKFESEGNLAVTAVTQPVEVRLWRATNEFARDFRAEKIGPAYRNTLVTADAEGVYRVSVPRPAKGWTAFFVELTFPDGGRYPFKFTTPVKVIPDTLPHPEPKPVKPPRPR